MASEHNDHQMLTEERKIPDSWLRKYVSLPTKEREQFFDIENACGQGGFGSVQKAYDRTLHRFVAIKQLLAQHNGSLDQIRLQQEAIASSRICHQNVVQVYEVNTDSKGPYIVLEFVDGASLEDLLTRDGAFDLQRLKPIVDGVCAGLTAAYRVIKCHRDIKPANLLLSRGGVVKIADFGIASLLKSVEPGQDSRYIGTRGFIAPELYANPELAGTLSDLWSLGVTVHRLLTGKAPQEHGSLDFNGLAPGVGRFLQKATHSEPAQRFQTPGEFRDSFLRAAESEAPALPGARRSRPVRASATVPAAIVTNKSDDRRRITYLSWTIAAVTDEHLQRLSDFTREGVYPLPRQNDLRHVNLSGSGITDRSLDLLAKLPMLKHLDVSRTRVTDLGVEHLLQSKTLSELNLRLCPITNRSIEILACIPTLTTLRLAGTGVDDACLAALQRMSQLSQLELKKTQVSEAGLAELSKNCPLLKILS